MKLTTEQCGTEGVVSKIRFQGARVRKPLLAVSGIIDKRNMVAFDADGSFIVPSNAPELPAIRALLAKARGRIPMHPKNGVFVLKAWEHKTRPPALGFSRPGRS